MDDFNFAINRFILININGNKSQKSWEQIARTFSVQASCARGCTPTGGRLSRNELIKFAQPRSADD